MNNTGQLYKCEKVVGSLREGSGFTDLYSGRTDLSKCQCIIGVPASENLHNNKGLGSIVQVSVHCTGRHLSY